MRNTAGVPAPIQARSPRRRRAPPPSAARPRSRGGSCPSRRGLRLPSGPRIADQARPARFRARRTVAGERPGRAMWLASMGALGSTGCGRARAGSPSYSDGGASCDGTLSSSAPTRRALTMRRPRSFSSIRYTRSNPARDRQRPQEFPGSRRRRAQDALQENSPPRGRHQRATGQHLEDTARPGSRRLERASTSSAAETLGVERAQDAVGRGDALAPDHVRHAEVRQPRRPVRLVHEHIGRFDVPGERCPADAARAERIRQMQRHA